MALLPGERAGKICTICAGSVSVEATLRARPGENLPPPTLPDPNAARYHALREDRDGGAYGLFCEVRALRRGDMAVAVDKLLRAISAHAALAGAVLESRVVRLGEPVVPDALLMGRLARDLRSAGLGVSFGPSWEPAPEAAIRVGASGREREIRRFFRESPAWQLAPL